VTILSRDALAHLPFLPSSLRRLLSSLHIQVSTTLTTTLESLSTRALHVSRSIVRFDLSIYLSYCIYDVAPSHPFRTYSVYLNLVREVKALRVSPNSPV